MDEEYEGNVEVFMNLLCCVCVCATAAFLSVLLINWLYPFHQATGEDYSVEPAESRRPFRALLDVGLIRTTTGNRVFGALKVIYHTAMLIGVILF